MQRKVHAVTIARQSKVAKNSCNEWGSGSGEQEAGKEVFKKGW